MPFDLRNDLLDHTEPILVHGQVDEILNHGVNDEVNVLFLHAKENFLQHVRAIGVESKVHNMILDALLQLLFLLRHVYHFDEALHRVSSLFVTGDLQDVRLQNIKDLVPLRRGRALEQSLAEVVSILVYHQGVHIIDAFFDRKVHEVWRSPSQNFLKLLTTMLMSCHLNNFASHLVLDLGVFGLSIGARASFLLS